MTEAHQSLYRKYRSQTFEELIGQEHVVRALRNAIGSGRIAHAYLFTGPRGTGKTSTARLLAKCLCAEGGPSAMPDTESEISKLISQGSCPDVLELDAASESGVDAIRQAIVEAVEYRPMMCAYKIFIIDEVHDLSTKAFDALLKTIEEPPPHVVFILATTEYNKVPATIRSRCQKYEFHRGSIADIETQLGKVASAEGVEFEAGALSAIARMADGGFRDALTLLEQAMITAEGKLTLEHVRGQLGLVSDEQVDSLLVGMAQSDPGSIMTTVDEVIRRGRHPRALLESAVLRLSDLTRAAYDVEGTGESGPHTAALRAIAAKIGKEKLLRLRIDIAEAHRLIRDVTLPRVWMESRLLGISLQLSAPAVQVAVPAARQQPESQAPRAAGLAVTPAAEAAPASAPVAVKPPTRSPAAPTNEAERLWAGVMTAIPAETPIHMRLSDSAAISFEGSELTVSLKRTQDYDWFSSDPKRLGFITKTLATVAGRELKLNLVKPASGQVYEKPQSAVELAIEGVALHDKLTETFATQ